jgi:RecG-like helicase
MSSTASAYQRIALKGKGATDVLIATATPIPRRSR